jgi:CubicO group peptidase (beta-lactamase class C family)
MAFERDIPVSSGTGDELAQRFARLDTRIQEEMARLGVPGVAVGVLAEGQEHVAGFGVTSSENPLPVDGDTLFQIGSTTKTFTATVAMRLVEQGKLDLDAPLRTYLPELRLADETAAAGVTLRHCFTHTGGWLGDYFDDTGMGGDALAKIVERMVNLPQLTPLGAIWAYNNSGFYLAGRTLEVVAGKPYEAVARELVLAPLGLERSFYFPWEVMTYRFAAGHSVRRDPPRVEHVWHLPRAANAAGGIASSARDQLRYARFQMGDGTAPDGTRLLSPESMRLMQTPQVEAGNGTDHMGIAWMLAHVGDVRIVRHGGGTNGQISAFLMVPARQFALTVLTNADRGGELNTVVTKWALREFLGAQEPEPTPLALTPEQLASYAGRYVGHMDDLELQVQGDGLLLVEHPKRGFPDPDDIPPAAPPMRASLVAPDRALVTDEPMAGSQADFLRGPDGAIVWFRAGGRVYRREG